MMMSLGMFLFSLPTLVYQDLSHKRDVRHAWNERFGRADAVQFIGPGEETITLTGVTAYGISKPGPSLAILNKMMQAGLAVPMIDGLGNVFGLYVIQAVDVKKDVFRKFGQAKRTEFTLDLRRADDPGGAIRNKLLDAALDKLAGPAQMIADKLSVASIADKLPFKLPGL